MEQQVGQMAQGVSSKDAITKEHLENLFEGRKLIVLKHYPPKVTTKSSKSQPTQDSFHSKK